MTTPLRVLLFAGDPFATDRPLKLDVEARRIEEAVQRATHRDAVRIVPWAATRRGDLQEAVLRHDPAVVHFSGHGDEHGMIHLGDEYNRPRLVSRPALVELFAIFAPALRMVVLNACHTGPTAEALSTVVDFAVGMDRPVGDNSAILFSESLYAALAAGRSVDDAFRLGRNRLTLEGARGADIPRLFVRPGADPAEVLASVAADAEAPRTGADRVVRVERFEGDVVRFRQTDAGGTPGGRSSTHVGEVKVREGLFEQS